MKATTRIGLPLFLAVVMVFTACKDDAQDPARVKMNLTDAPARYDAVYIDVREVKVHVEDADDAGWKSLDANPGIYNLLDLTNGIDTLIAEGEVPPGRISQIRLILGPDNSVVVDGVQKDLNTPSAQQSGLKLNVHYDLDPGLKYEFWLDFDARRSIVETGSGMYNLKPVIRVFTKTTTGSIEGYVDPAASHPWVLAYNGAGDSASARADLSTGYFLLPGLNAGTYAVEFDAVDPYNDKTIPNVPVTVGSVYNMDTIPVVQ